MRKSRGNISLQMGKFVTADKLEERRKRNLRYSFTE